MENATLAAARVLSSARNAGIRLGVERGDLLLEADTPPTASLLTDLSKHKPEIVRLLAQLDDDWGVEEWRSFFDQRTRLAMIKAGKTPAAAKAIASDCCIIEWLNRHPEPSEPGHCAHCGKRERAEQAVVPFGVKRQSHAWLHSDCWLDWQRERHDRARRALECLGISTATLDCEKFKFPDDFEKNRNL